MSSALVHGEKLFDPLAALRRYAPDTGRTQTRERPLLGLLEAIVLGIIQGATEFLPVSSSGHLVIAQHLLGLGGSENIAFDLLLHAATLGAVIVALRRELLTLARGFWKERDQRRLAVALVLSLLATAAVGLVLESSVHDTFNRPTTVGLLLIGTGTLLFLSPRVGSGSSPLTQVTWSQALGIGLLQGVAALPGLSRSGTTICAGILLGLRPDAATRYSFLLSIPTIAAAIVWNLSRQGAETIGALPALGGMGAALIVGMASIRWLLQIARRGRFDLFAYYTVVLGLLILLIKWVVPLIR